MKIETTYNIDAKVYVIYNNKVYEGLITGISYVTCTNMCSWGNNLKYCVCIAPNQQYECSEDMLFSTKQDLLNSL